MKCYSLGESTVSSKLEKNNCSLDQPIKSLISLDNSLSKVPASEVKSWVTQEFTISLSEKGGQKDEDTEYFHRNDDLVTTEPGIKEKDSIQIPIE